MACKSLGILAAIALLLVAGVTPASAASNPQCLPLDTKYQQLVSGLQPKESALNQVRIKTGYDNGQAPVLLEAKILTTQKEGDKKRQAVFKKLRSKAKTAAQKTALTAYETEFGGALQALRQSQDAARDYYLGTYNNLSAAHHAEIDSQLLALKKQFEAAYTSAATQCPKTGIEKTTLQLRNGIKLAQDTYSLASRGSTKNTQDALREAAVSYHASAAKAAAAFEETMVLSEAKLKTAFSKTTNIFE